VTADDLINAIATTPFLMRKKRWPSLPTKNTTLPYPIIGGYINVGEHGCFWNVKEGEGDYGARGLW
jgi:hypothetical protein